MIYGKAILKTCPFQLGQCIYSRALFVQVSLKCLPLYLFTEEAMLYRCEEMRKPSLNV